ADALNRALHSGELLSDQGILGQTLLMRQACSSNDIAVDAHFPASSVLQEELGLRSILSVPLLTETTIHGLFFLGSSDTGGFTPLKADILTLFANQASIAIHNSLLVDALEKRERHVTSNGTIDVSISSHKRHVIHETNVSSESASQ